MTALFIVAFFLGSVISFFMRFISNPIFFAKFKRCFFGQLPTAIVRHPQQAFGVVNLKFFGRVKGRTLQHDLCNFRRHYAYAVFKSVSGLNAGATIAKSSDQFGKNDHCIALLSGASNPPNVLSPINNERIGIG